MLVLFTEWDADMGGPVGESEQAALVPPVSNKHFHRLLNWKKT